MKVAVIGSRSITTANIGDYLPEKTTEIASGGAKSGVDVLAKKYAHEHGIEYTEFLPEYEKYKRGAPLKRNETIVNYSDFIVAIYDGSSKGTRYVIDYAKKVGKPCEVHVIM
ncbi:hypothetical protein AGMMS49975_13770 [Clostridia bacterium]|nr:hypothetical protein AGMMS49975_13770 [Clostridia bacterium]